MEAELKDREGKSSSTVFERLSWAVQITIWVLEVNGNVGQDCKCVPLVIGGEGKGGTFAQNGVHHS